MNTATTAAQTLFARQEQKYLLTPAQHTQLVRAIAPHMHPDAYGQHTIQSIYCDTDDYALIRQSLDKPAFKQKLRLRSYGTPTEDADVYLELKKKLRGTTYKRRLPMTLAQARAYLLRGIAPQTEDTQTLGELDWFIARMRPQPRVLIAYDRIAYVGRADDTLRLTTDASIRWRATRLDLGLGDSGSLLLPAGTRVMEIKTQSALPLWLCEALSDLRIYPQSFSKYGTVYRRHLLPGKEEVARHAG